MRLTGPFTSVLFSPAVVALASFHPVPCLGQDFPPQPPTITITPDSVTVPVGDTLSLAATVVDSDGDTLDVGVRWESLAPEIVSVSQVGSVRPTRLERARIVARTSGAADTAVVLGGTSLTAEAFVVDSTELALVSDRFEHEEGVLRFEVLTREPPDLREGTVLVGAQGEGFLRRVEALEWQGGKTVTVFTSGAALTDVLRAGGLELEVILLQPCLEVGCDDETSGRLSEPPAALAWSRPGNAGPGAYRARETCAHGRPSATDEIRCGPTEISHVAGTADFTARGLEFEQVFAGASLEIALRQTVQLVPTARLSYRVNKLFGLPTDVEHLQVDFRADVRGTAEGTVRIEKSLERADLVRIASFTRPFFGSPGFPVKGRVTTSLWAGYRAEADGRGVLSSGRQAMSSSAEASLRWDDAGWDPGGKVDPPRYSSRDPSLTGELATTARLFVRPAVRIILYGVAGPDVWLDPYLEGEGAVRRDRGGCDLEVELFAGMDGSVGLAWSSYTQPVADILGVGELTPWEFGVARERLTGSSAPC